MSNTEPMDNILILNDADGNAVRFEFLDLIPYGGHEYVVLYPVDVDDGDVVILMVDEDPNVTEESYVAVEDDAIVQAVFRIFKEMNKEEYTFTDNDSPNTVASSGDKPVKYRARLGVLLVAWFGAWLGCTITGWVTTNRLPGSAGIWAVSSVSLTLFAGLCMWWSR